MESYIEPCNEDCAFCFLNYTDELGMNPLFRGIEKKLLGTIIKCIHHSVRQLDTSEVLAVEGDVLSQLMIIIKGTVVGEMVDYSGNILRVEKLSAPQTIATAFLFGNKGRLPVSITAVEPTKMFCISKEDLLELFSQQKQVLKNFLDIISDRSQFLSERIKLLSIPGLRGKLAFYLLELSRRTGNTEFILPDTQQELAERFGTTRPSVGRIIRQLHEESIIFAERKKVRILDNTALNNILKA